MSQTLTHHHMNLVHDLPAHIQGLVEASLELPTLLLAFEDFHELHGNRHSLAPAHDMNVAVALSKQAEGGPNIASQLPLDTDPHLVGQHPFSGRSLELLVLAWVLLR